MRLMSADGRWARFLRKPPQDKLAALRATLRLVLRGGRQRHEFPLGHRWAAPAALRAGLPFCLAARPEADVQHHALPELAALGELWVRRNARNAEDLPRLYALALNIRAVLAEGIAGDFAELGVYRGNSASVLAHYARGAGREVLLFDTFAGFDRRDFTGPDRDRAMEFADTSLDAVRDLVGEANVRYLPGYFPDSLLPGMDARRFALVHLDCDLYEPIRAGMAFFFPRLAPGGLMIVHDYAGIYWDGVKQAVDECLAGRPERPVLLPDRSGTAMIRKAAA